MRDLQNDRLDEIGRKLLKASKMQTDEIEKIAAAPHLFRSVRTRIDAESNKQLKKGFFKTGMGVSVWTWRFSLMASGLVAVVLTVVIGLSISTKKATPQGRTTVPVHQEPDRIIAPDHDRTEFPTDEIHTAVTTNEPYIQRAGFRNKVRTTEPRKQVKTEEVGEFQPLTYTDDREMEDDGGQIVRVELPRSSLVAMGVDVPSENRADRLKTDLLIGSDGVMKAVRLVK